MSNEDKLKEYALLMYKAIYAWYSADGGSEDMVYSAPVYWMLRMDAVARRDVIIEIMNGWNPSENQPTENP